MKKKGTKKSDKNGKEMIVKDEFFKKEQENDKKKSLNIQKKDILFEKKGLFHPPMKKKMDIDILFLPTEKDFNTKEMMESPFKLFDFFRNVHQKPIDLERLTYEEIKITNKLLRRILYFLKR